MVVLGAEVAVAIYVAIVMCAKFLSCVCGDSCKEVVWREEEEKATPQLETEEVTS